MFLVQGDLAFIFSPPKKSSTPSPPHTVRILAIFQDRERYALFAVNPHFTVSKVGD